MDYFRRVYKLEIGSDDEIRTFDGFPDSTASPAQIEFRIDQTPNAMRSYAEITLYGLSAASRQAITQRFQKVRLTAGYVGSYGQIFIGEIENVSMGRAGAESFVRMYCQAGADKFGAVYVSRGFGANTPALEIILAVAETFGYPIEVIGDFSQLPRAIRGEVLFGASQIEMDKLARRYGFRWFIENGQVTIIKHDATRPGAAFQFTAQNGLIGSPELAVDGVSIDVLLNPVIRPADQFTVEAVTARASFHSIYYQRFTGLGRGLYRVTSLQHEGSFYGDRWQTKLHGARPEGLQ